MSEFSVEGLQPPTVEVWEQKEVPNGHSLSMNLYRLEGPEKPGCRVYWGSHGCQLMRGHDGPHKCDCCECEIHPAPDSGCVATAPYYGWRTWFYGEDAPKWQPLAWVFQVQFKVSRFVKRHTVWRADA